MARSWTATTTIMNCQYCDAQVVGDVCTSCGARLSAAPPLAQAQSNATLPTQPSATSAQPTSQNKPFHPERTECPLELGGCGNPRTKITPFCKCGFDFRNLQSQNIVPQPQAQQVVPAVLPAPLTQSQPADVTKWRVTISLKPELYTEKKKDVEFPSNPPHPVSFLIGEERVLFGRRSTREGSVEPDIPLFGVDHAVSNRQFELTPLADDRWSLHQLGANGTRVNGKPVLKDNVVAIEGRIICTLGYFTEIVIEPVLPDAT